MGKILLFAGMAFIVITGVFFFLQESWRGAEFWTNILVGPSVLLTLGGAGLMIWKGK